MKKLLATLGLALVLTTMSVSAKTAGSVNGMKITVAEANKALKLLTKGKMTWAKLPKDGKKQLIEMMAPSKLVSAASKRGLSKKEKESALAGYWMQKKTAKIRISDKEAKKTYNEMKKAAKKIKSKKKIPPFSKSKNNIKMQLAQERVVKHLMKNAKIRVK